MILLSHLKVSGLLSFGPDGVDLPLKRLNVLIGPNGSGKSNLLEVLALLRASPTNLPAPIKSMGGIDEWLWKPVSTQPPSHGPASARIEAGVAHVGTEGLMFVHSLRFGSNGGRFELFEEEIANPPEAEPWWYYRFQKGHASLNRIRPVTLHGNVVEDGEANIRELSRDELHPEESILSQLKDPARYNFLTYLRVYYARIALHRNWTFGPSVEFRKGTRIDERDDAPSERNLPNVVAALALHPEAKRRFLEAARQIYDGMVDVEVVPQAGKLQLFVTEAGGRQIPATRLSDGTLRYLWLLGILLDPKPPNLVAIEEPELGLHPDVIPLVAELMIEASQRMQLVVTTHSRMLVDALGEVPDSVVVCEKVNGQSRFDRLDPERLKEWLEQYSLGDLWSRGEIGGNRW